MAATGVLAAALWFGGIGLLLWATGGSSTIGFFFMFGLFFVPLTIPAAFLSGVVLWRYAYPETDRRLYGALFGALVAFSGLFSGAVGLALFSGVANLVDGAMGVGEAVAFAVFLTPVAFVFAIVAAGWLVIPLGAFGGWYHERAKANVERRPPA